MEKIPIRPAARPSSPSRLSSYSLSFVSRAPTQKSRPRPISQSDAGRVASSAIVLPIEISAGQSGIGSTPLPNCVPLLNINPPRGNEEIRGAMLCFDWQASYMCSFDTLGGGKGLCWDYARGSAQHSKLFSPSKIYRGYKMAARFRCLLLFKKKKRRKKGACVSVR